MGKPSVPARYRTTLRVNLRTGERSYEPPYPTPSQGKGYRQRRDVPTQLTDADGRMEPALEQYLADGEVRRRILDHIDGHNARWGALVRLRLDRHLSFDEAGPLLVPPVSGNAARQMFHRARLWLRIEYKHLHDALRHEEQLAS